MYTRCGGGGYPCLSDDKNLVACLSGEPASKSLRSKEAPASGEDLDDDFWLMKVNVCTTIRQCLGRCCEKSRAWPCLAERQSVAGAACAPAHAIIRRSRQQGRDRVCSH